VLSFFDPAAQRQEWIEYELLNGEIFYSLKEVEILTEKWRREHNNTIRPNSSLGYKPPATETISLKQAVRLI
jgi:hypothetical protein